MGIKHELFQHHYVACAISITQRTSQKEPLRRLKSFENGRRTPCSSSKVGFRFRRERLVAINLSKLRLHITLLFHVTCCIIMLNSTSLVVGVENSEVDCSVQII